MNPPQVSEAQPRLLCDLSGAQKVLLVLENFMAKPSVLKSSVQAAHLFFFLRVLPAEAVIL